MNSNCNDVPPIRKRCACYVNLCSICENPALCAMSERRYMTSHNDYFALLYDVIDELWLAVMWCECRSKVS